MTRYVEAHGRIIAVEELDTGVKPSKARRREAGLFIRVPLKRAEEVCKAVGVQNAFVWVLLLHMAFVKRSSTFPCSNTLMRMFGIRREMKRRALAKLEAAGLITVQRHRCRAPLVTLIGV
jgi:hypothetical protein